MGRHTGRPRGPGDAPARGAPGPAGAPARAATAQSVPVTLSWRVADGFLTLTATTPGAGSSFQDSWSTSPSVALVASRTETAGDTPAPDPTGIVSRAAIAASSLVRDTTYTFGYWIAIRTSEHTWFGSGSVTITVGPDGTLVSPLGGADLGG